MLKKVLVQILLLSLALFITYHTYRIQENTCEKGHPLFEGAVCGDSQYGKVGGWPFHFVKDGGSYSVLDSINPIGEDEINWKWFCVDMAIFWVVLQPVLLAVKKYKNEKKKNLLFQLCITTLFALVVFVFGWLFGAQFGGNNYFFEYHGLPGYEAGGLFGSIIGLLCGIFLGLFLSIKANQKFFPTKSILKLLSIVFLIDFILGYFFQLPWVQGAGLLIMFLPIFASVFIANSKKYGSK